MKLTKEPYLAMRKLTFESHLPNISNTRLGDTFVPFTMKI